MAKETFGWFLESFKKKRAEKKLSKELLKTLNDGHYLDWDKYSKLPDRVAYDLIKQWYWNEVINHIDKFENKNSEIIDELMFKWYDITEFVYKNKYRLTHTRILHLIMYRPGIICRIGSFPWTGKTSVDEKLWMRLVLIDYEYFKYSWTSPKLRNEKSFDRISKEFLEMNDEDVSWEYYWPKPWESIGASRNWRIRMYTYWYNRVGVWFRETLTKSEIKPLKK